jgi:RNA exonuclease 4
LTDEVAMDCEMVGVSQGTKSALGRVTLVNKWGNVLYDEFVRPVEHVVDFRTSISGIRPRDLRKAKDFRVAQTKVAELIKGKILVGHALHNDLKALLLTHPKKDIRDTGEYQPFLKYSHSNPSLSLSDTCHTFFSQSYFKPLNRVLMKLVIFQTGAKQESL